MKKYLSSLTSHILLHEGFTLIELMVVLSISAVLGILGIAGFTKYNQVQVLQTSVNNLTTTLNLARSRAASQVKPSACIGQLDGYSVFISPPKTYELNVVCSGRDFLIQRVALPDNITFTQNQSTTTFFPVLGGKITGAGTIELSGYGQTKTIVVSEIGIFASAVIPTVPPTTPAPTPIPSATPIPTPTPILTPTPTPTVSPKRVFVTSKTYNGDLKKVANELPGPDVEDGLTAGDKLCQTRADAKNLGGKWTAWLSTRIVPVNAIDRLTGNHSYSKLNNQIVATSKADLTDGTILNTISVDENLNTAGSPNFAWTGTKEDGTRAVDGFFLNSSACDDWTTAQFGGAAIGNTGAVDANWTIIRDVTACWNQFRLYCFEQ